MVIKMNRETKLKMIAENKGYFTIQDICDVYGLFYDTRRGQEYALGQIRVLKNMGLVHTIEGTQFPVKLAFNEQLLAA